MRRGRRLLPASAALVALLGLGWFSGPVYRIDARVAPPALPEDFEPAMGAIPAVGQHTEAILAELGYGAGEIAALRAGGAL